MASPALAAQAPGLAACLREYVVKYRRALDERVAVAAPTPLGTRAALESGRTFARAIDGLLSALLPATQATLSAPAGKGRSKKSRWVDCTLAAVGSYGRGVLAPHSDLDVRLVVDRRPEDAQHVAEALLYPLWDAGLHVGHQVIDPEGVLELARTDLSTATSLLDLRVVAGPRPRVEQLVERALAGFFTGELGSFVQRLRDERKARHARYGGSLYLLEPDVKSGPGGLRDLDLARWAARARYRVRETAELVRLGVLLPREHDELAEAEAFLWAVRARLHTRAGRRSDRLTFDAQEELGRLLVGVEADEPDAIAAERLMQRYYGHARTVERMVERVLDVCTPSKPRRSATLGEAIAPGIKSFEGQATLENLADLASDPALAMRLYHTAHKRGLPVYPYARDAVAKALHNPAAGEALRASKEASRLFLDALCDAAERNPNTPSVLRQMHDVGLLLAMVPEFQPVVGRVHHDIYHVYTVDVHSVAAVDRLRALARGAVATEYPLACRLAGDLARKVPLYVATLLHDVGKGGGGVGHGERGAEMSRAICARLGLSEEDAAEVHWLILQHLAMYHVATRRDLDDPGTVASFGDVMRASGGSPIERLHHLYLLTVADISTTSPTAMTTWKARMLDDLFLATSHHLAASQRGEETADELLARVRKEAQAAWPVPALDRFVDGMPKAYLIGHAGETVAAHARVVMRRGGSCVIVDHVPPRHPDTLELIIVAPDRPGLLLSFAAALAANRLDILTAHIFVWERPESSSGGAGREAVDFFSVRRAARDGDEAIEPLGERELARLEADLTGLIEGRVDPVGLLHDRRGAGPLKERPSPAVDTSVEIDDRASRRFTVIDVYAKDRPGLLFAVARALHGLQLSIARSKIATEGACAADSFYVTELDGGKVQSPARREEIKTTVAAAIERLSREGIAS